MDYCPLFCARRHRRQGEKGLQRGRENLEKLFGDSIRMTKEMKCAELQRSIIEDIWSSLKPGGILVYSTCTFNLREDEENVRWITEELGAEVLPVDTKPEWNITGSLLEGWDKPVYRFIPGITRTCPSVPLPAPIPMVGIANSEETRFAKVAWIFSKTRLKQPISCNKCASSINLLASASSFARTA